MNKMAKSKHKEFTEYSLKGQEFIRIWNSEWRDGAQVRLAEHYGISIPTVYRIRKKLNLPDLMSTPARIKWERQVVKNYLNKQWSTLRMAKIYKMCSQNINMVLKKHNVELRPQCTVNCAYFKTRQLDYSPARLLKEIKKLYLDENMTVVQTAKKLKIDPGTVTNKLRAMNIEIRINNHRSIIGNYPCQWCGITMDKVWQNKGLRKQKYCNSVCKNKAKDLRRMIGGQRKADTRLEKMLGELKDNWPNQYNVAYDRIMNVEPVIKEPAPIPQSELDLKAEDWVRKWKPKSIVHTVEK